jgi:hypothetical protein
MTGFNLQKPEKNMKIALSSLFEKPIIYHPFLFALLFILREFQDSYKFIPWVELIVTTFLLLFIVFAILLTTIYLTNDKKKGALITSAFLVWVLYYTDFLNFLFRFETISRLINRGYIFSIVLWAFLFILFCAYVFSSQRQFKRTNLYMTILCVIMISIQVGEINLLDRLMDADYRNYIVNKENYALNPGKIGKKPDIYYIIFDSYTSFNSLKEFWQYDNSSLLTFLKQKGFFVAEDSRSPHTWTASSIASSLNLSAIDPNLRKLPAGVSSSITYNMLRSNKATASLMGIGYDFKNLSLFDIAGFPRFYTYPEMMSGKSSFSSAMYEKTLIGTIKKRCLELKDFSKINMSIFDELKKSNNWKHDKPVFVYAHFMMPHWPYQFDRNGHITPAEQFRRTITRKDLYLEQLIYTNQIIMEIVNTLLSNRKNLPIIIIQGDHGFRMIDGPDKDKESQTILNAYFLPNPNGGRCILYNNISPINTFRVIFNCYFGTNYELINEAYI